MLPAVEQKKNETIDETCKKEKKLIKSEQGRKKRDKSSLSRGQMGPVDCKIKARKMWRREKPC
jgi:hypothetical protein